jgi:hypothetical protein
VLSAPSRALGALQAFVDTSLDDALHGADDVAGTQ